MWSVVFDENSERHGQEAASVCAFNPEKKIVLSFVFFTACDFPSAV